MSWSLTFRHLLGVARHVLSLCCIILQQGKSWKTALAATFHELETPKTSHSCLKKWYFPIFSKMIILQHSLSAAKNHRGKSRIGLPELDRPFSGSLTSAKEDCWKRKATVKIVHGIFTYIYHKNQPNVGEFTIHWSFGLENFDQLLLV